MKRVLNQQTFNGGIADSEKEGLPGSAYFYYQLDIYRDPRYIEIFPRTVKVSESIITGLVKWIVPATSYTDKIFALDENGAIYQQAGGVWSKLQTTANCKGQGLEVYSDYLYYAQNNQLGRYGPLSTGASFTDAWQTGLNNTAPSGFAPVKAFKEGLAIGHGNYLGWFDGSVWDADRLVLPPSFNIRTLEVYNEYLVIGTYCGESITDNEEGYLFFWDGTSDTFNFFATASEGGAAAILNSKNRLISFMGADGMFYQNFEPFVKLQQMPYLDIDEYIDIYPGAVSTWRGVALFGIAGATNSVNTLRGVYAYGARSGKYPDALSFAFSISTGNTGSTVAIGAVKGVGNELYIGWSDNGVYGVDLVRNTNSCFTTGYLKQLFFDDNRLYTDKFADRLKAYHLSLAAGQTITLSSTIDRAETVSGSANSSGVETALDINKRFREVQNMVTLGSSSGVSPRIMSLSMLYDDFTQEKDF